MMLPHWKRFAKALNGRTSVNKVEFTGISMPSSVLDFMFPTLQSMNLIELMLCGIGLGSEGYQSFSSFIKDNTSLKHLVIGVERIHNISIAGSLADALKDHPTLERVSFGSVGLDNTALEIILEGCKTIKEIVMVFCNLGSNNDIAVLADFIGRNCPTETIILGEDEITDADALVLASTLKENTNLKRLSLKNNEITEEGEKHLLNALFDTSSMDSIIESNHTCKVYTYDTSKPSIVALRPPIEKEVIEINGDDHLSIRRKIREKVVLALCGVDGCMFDLSHFNDLPLQLMPRVLELIQKHSWMRCIAVDYKQLRNDSLSRLFHTLRGWELPLLFNNLSPANETMGERKRRKTCR